MAIRRERQALRRRIWEGIQMSKISNPSKTVLVSVGDSFTFGQGVVNNIEPVSLWKNKCNALSYTSQLKTLLGCKDSINLGWSGASNSNIYYQITQIYDQIKNNKENDYFFIVALTSYERDTIYTKSSVHNDKHVLYDFNYQSWREHNENKKLDGWPYKSDIVHNMSSKTVEDMMLYYNNKMSMILKTISAFNSIVDFFNARNMNFLIFDLLNVTSQFRIRDAVLNELAVSGSQGVIYNNQIKLRSMYDIYYENLQTNTVPQYVNQFNSEFTNMKDYIDSFDNTRSNVQDDGHWNEYGHSICANLLKEWIQK